MLALIAGVVAPVRAMCGTTCAVPAVAAETVAPAPPCHESAEAPPAPEQHDAADPCSHDHSASVRPAARPVVADATPVQFAPGAPVPVFDIPRIEATVHVFAHRLTRGSPPDRLRPLRI